MIFNKATLHILANDDLDTFLKQQTEAELIKEKEELLVVSILCDPSTRIGQAIRRLVLQIQDLSDLERPWLNNLDESFVLLVSGWQQATPEYIKTHQETLKLILIAREDTDQLRQLYELFKGQESLGQGQTNTKAPFYKQTGLLAAFLGKLESLKVVEEYERNVSTQSTHGNSKCIHMGAYDGHQAIVEWLLSKDVRLVNETNQQKNSPLHLAVLGDHAELVKFLVRVNGVRVNARNQNDQTPLMIAAKKGNIAVVKAFVAGDPSLLNEDRMESAMDLAASLGHKDVVQFLLSLEGKTINNSVICRALLAAASANHLAAVDLIFKAMMTPNQLELYYLSLRETIDSLRNEKNEAPKRIPKTLDDSLYFYKLMLNKNFITAKQWLMSHDHLLLHFNIRDYGTLFHFIARYYETNSELLSEILMLMTEKHGADPYMVDDNGKRAFEQLKKQGSAVPDAFFGRESHVHLHRLFNPEVMQLLQKVLVSGFVPNKDSTTEYKPERNKDAIQIMLSPVELTQLLQFEIQLLLESISNQSNIPTPDSLLHALNSLLKVDSKKRRLTLLPMQLTPTQTDNLNVMVINLQRLSRLVYIENAESEEAVASVVIDHTVIQVSHAFLKDFAPDKLPVASAPSASGDIDKADSSLTNNPSAFFESNETTYFYRLSRSKIQSVEPFQ